MTAQKPPKLLLWGVGVIAFCAVISPFALKYALEMGRQSQLARIERTRPWLELHVTSKIKAGDSREHVREVFKKAGLSCGYEEDPRASKQLSAAMFVDSGCGWKIVVEFNERFEATAVDLQQITTL